MDVAAVRPAVRLSVWQISTGLRRGEAMALRWENVFDDRIEAMATVSKNGRRRSVPIIPAARDALTRLRALDNDGQPSQPEGWLGRLAAGSKMKAPFY